MDKTTSATGINGSGIKLQNISAILLNLLYNNNLSRVTLARMIGVSTATITNLVAELVIEGLIVEEGFIRVDGQPNVGRPQKALQLVPDARYALAIHIDVGRVYLAITNLQGHILQRQTIEHDLQTPWQDVMDAIVTEAQIIIQQQAISLDDLVGAGIAASGLVDPITGVNIIAPNLNWHNVPIADYLSDALNLPIMVDNNVRAMALGESLFHLQNDINTIAFVYARMGVGAGFVMNGQVYRGAGAGAGEIGHTTMLITRDDNNLHPQSLESLFSEPALKRDAQIIAQKHPESILARAIQADGLHINTIFNAALQGDTLTIQLLEERATFFGIALANVVNLFNPEVIVLGGIFIHEMNLLIPTIEKALKRYAFANLADKVNLRVTSYGRDAGIVGAAALALDTFFYRPRHQWTLTS